MPGPIPAPPERRELLLLLLLTLMGCALRFYRLGAQSLWIDEYLMIQRASLGEPFRWGDWFVNPQGPLPALVLRLWTGVAGTGEEALRFPSALFGTLTIPVVYLMARQVQPGAAIAAAGLATFSPFLVWYSQETRHYALAILASAASFWTLLRLERLARPRFGDYAAAALSLLAGLMSHLTMAFVALGQFGALLLSRRFTLVRRWLLAVAPAFLLMTPWFWVAVTRNLNLQHVASAGPIPAEEMLRGESTFSWLGLPYTAFVFFAGYSLGPSLAELHAAPRLATLVPHLPLIGLLGAGVALLLGAGFVELRRHRFARDLTILSIAIPLFFVVVLSLRNARVFNPRYLAVGLPLLLAAAGLGWDLLRRTARGLAVVALALVLVPTLVSLGNYYRGGVYAREDVRSAARLLEREATPNDLILGQGAPQVLEWYYAGPAPLQVVYGVWVANNRPGLEARVDAWSRGRDNLWLLITRPWLEDPGFRLKSLLEARFGPGEMHLFDGVTLIRYKVKG